MRVYTAVKLILYNAGYWDKMLNTSMSIRTEKDAQSGNSVFLEHKDGLAGVAAENRENGVKLETINGKPYYTREFTASSGTSTWKNEYFIDVWLENAPYDTMLVNEQNERLVFDGSRWKLPTEYRETDLNDNEEEFYGTFKICLPVQMCGEEGEIGVYSASSVAQYHIYRADNPAHSEQSFVIADPAYTTVEAAASLKWATTESLYGSVQLTKVDGSGQPLAGALFVLEGMGRSYAGTSGADGRVLWENLEPGAYTIRETQAPQGFRLAGAENVLVAANEVAPVTVRNDSFRTFTLRKTDAQNGASLRGAVFVFVK
jgi:uncharacterized surface anchored protein